MITRALHALARGLDAVAGHIEQAASPPAEHLGRARVTVTPAVEGYPLPPSSLHARHDLQFQHLGRQLDPMDEGDSFELGRRLGVDQTTRTLLGIEPGPNVVLAVVDLEEAARALMHHHPLYVTEQGPISGCSCGGIRWGDSWAEHAAGAVFDALPTVQGRTVDPDRERPPAGWLRRPGLEDTDPEVIERLREMGDRWGPLGVAIVASALTDPNVLVAHLRSHASTRVVPQYEDETEGEKSDEPAPGQSLIVVPDGWMPVQAGQLTEFLGRTIALPPDRENVPHEPVVLESARFEHHHDGNTTPDAVLITLAGHAEPYMLMPNDQVKVQTR